MDERTKRGQREEDSDGDDATRGLKKNGDGLNAPHVITAMTLRESWPVTAKKAEGAKRNPESTHPRQQP